MKTHIFVQNGDMEADFSLEDVGDKADNQADLTKTLCSGWNIYICSQLSKTVWLFMTILLCCLEQKREKEREEKEAGPEILTDASLRAAGAVPPLSFWGLHGG